MSSPRALSTTVAMILVAGLVVAMMALLWMVGQDLLQLKGARADVSLKLRNVEAKAKDLWDELQQAKADRRKLGEELKKATDALESLRAEAIATQARLKALEEARPRVEVAPVPPAEQPAPAPPAAPQPVEGLARLIERAREDPGFLPIAARRGFQEKGIAGIGLVLGLDEAAQARFLKVYGDFILRARAADKAHAKVALEGDAVVIEISPYQEEGHALLKAWQDLLAQALTPAQQEAWAAARADRILFERPLGHYAETIRLTRDAMGVKYEHKGRRAGAGVNTFESAGTVSGEGAVDRLPWRHLLPDEAVAKLRGVARP
ncbi:MAG TPA: hypothetical protein VNE39_22370 [Planctomycetota bacterium]|nr:hypothetical protein [Planctomycetota bacterium]